LEAHRREKHGKRLAGPRPFSFDETRSAKGFERPMDGFHQTLMRVLEGDFDDASDEEKDCAVRRLIQTGCAAATVVALQPVPALDIALLMPIQVGMVQGIGRVHGYRLDKKSVLEILRNVRTGLATQHATLIAAKLVPAVGTLIAACVANGLTYAVGTLGDHYFRDGRNMMPEMMRATLRGAYAEDLQKTCKSKWCEIRDFFWGRPHVAKRLKEVERARCEGRIGDEEAERQVEEIMTPAETPDAR
jgi:uncharacterized protein (DUF697 family)